MPGSCGINCKTCPIFKAAEDSEFAERLAAEWRKNGNEKAVADWFKCEGCHGDDNLVWSGNCQIRKCSHKERQLENCSLCPAFPCSMIDEFETDGHAHHKSAVENLKKLRQEKRS